MSIAPTPLDITTPVTLEGSTVRLQPIRREHAQLFWGAAKDALEDIFRWIPYPMRTPEDFQRVVDKAFTEQDCGESVVFATVERSSGRAVTSLRGQAACATPSTSAFWTRSGRRRRRGWKSCSRGKLRQRMFESSPAMNWMPGITLPTRFLSLVKNKSVPAVAAQAR